MDSVSRHWNIVAWESCPWCVKAQEFLEENGQVYTVEFCERGTLALAEQKQKNNWGTVPMVTLLTTIDGTTSENFVGGYDNLIKFFEQEFDSLAAGACPVGEKKIK